MENEPELVEREQPFTTLPRIKSIFAGETVSGRPPLMPNEHNKKLLLTEAEVH